jgi:hypothetical protein
VGGPGVDRGLSRQESKAPFHKDQLVPTASEIRPNEAATPDRCRSSGIQVMASRYIWLKAALAGSVPIRVPESSSVMASSSSRVRVIPAAAGFSRIRWGWVVLGITMLPTPRCQPSTICAGVASCWCASDQAARALAERLRRPMEDPLTAPESWCKRVSQPSACARTVGPIPFLCVAWRSLLEPHRAVLASDRLALQRRGREAIQRFTFGWRSSLTG